AVVAYLLDPVVDVLEKRNIPRPRAILLVFFMAVMLVLILLATVVPQLIYETSQLVDRVPGYAEELRDRLGGWLEQSPWGAKAKQAWDEQLGASAQEWFVNALPVVSAWLLAQLTKVASWAGLLFGFALVPVYAFYFLLEKKGIEGTWTDYLPLQESKVKEEVVFVLKEINNCLIVFFRGQVLVALCVGALLTLGFLAIGLNYALLLGVAAGVLSVVPYLGIMMSIVPAVTLAAVQSHNLWHPLLVCLVFALVQMAEGLFISPKIIGERVGLHPLTIIIAVMVGTTLLGGILGGVLAIPLTAALRTLMFRYVWKRGVRGRSNRNA
ncbi:MAG: AI-2E family transporter, partial [Pedosphaera parvula]|nr:AI-2E family transporter [Pedosphaera parvula]